jgi:hypothetical protein
MGAWETLLQQAQPGKRAAPVKPPKQPIAAANDATPTASLPAGLSGAISVLTAAEQALLDTPAILAALVAELPTCCGWDAWPVANRRDWVRERLGLSASRFWVITMNGRRDLVEFVEPQTREALLERAARNRPGIGSKSPPHYRLKRYAITLTSLWIPLKTRQWNLICSKQPCYPIPLHSEPARLSLRYRRRNCYRARALRFATWLNQGGGTSVIGTVDVTGYRPLGVGY